MKEAGEKAREGDWARELYWQDAEPLVASAPTHYSITASTCHSIAHRAPSRAWSHTSPFTYAEGEGVGVGKWCRAHLSTAAIKLRRLFNFHLLFYYNMAEVPSSTFNPWARRLARSFNFNRRHQLHPSSTSILLDNFIPRRSKLQPSSPFKIQTPVDVKSAPHAKHTTSRTKLA
jgi:hypothetical protein